MYDKPSRLLEALAEKISALPEDAREPIERDLRRLRDSLEGPRAVDPRPASQQAYDDALAPIEILENMLEGCQVLDGEGRYIYINPQARQAYQENGFDAAALVGKKMLGDVFAEQDQNATSQAVRRVMAERIPVEVEYYYPPWKSWWMVRVVPRKEGGVLIFSKDITERMRMIENLRVSEKNLTDLIKHAPAGIYEIDFRTRHFTTVNDAMTALTGYSREELLVMDAYEILDETGQQTFQKRTNQWLSGIRPEENVEYRVKKKDGQKVDVMLNVTFKNDEAGRPVGATVVGFDVTRIKAAERERVEANRRAEENRLILEAVIQQMPVGIILTDASGQQARTNAEMDRIWRSNLAAENTAESRYPGFRADGQEYRLEDWPLARALRSGKGSSIKEMTILRGDGTEGIIETAAAPIHDQQGRVIAGVAIVMDITARKRQEAALSESDHALRQSQAFLSKLVNTSYEGIWAGDMNGKTTFMNQQAAEMLGYTIEEIWDRNALQFLMAGHEEQTRESMARIARGQSGRDEVCVQHRDGRELRVLVSYSPMMDENGAPQGMIAMFSDITERSRAEEALRVSEGRERARAMEMEAIMDTVPAIIWISRDPECRNMIGNRYGYQFLKMGANENLSKTAPEAELNRQPYRNFKDGRPLPSEDLPMQIAAATGKPARDFEFELHFDSGEVRHLLGNVNALFDPQGKPSGAVGAFIDVTTLRRLQNQQIQALAEREVHHRLMEQREKERQSYAREIHDGPIQTLASIGFNLKFVKDAYPMPALHVELDQIGLSVKSAIQELREMINELRPPSVIRFGLARAIRLHAGDIQERYPLIKWSHRLAEDMNLLPEPVCLALYRIYQEAVNNIVRHSEATRAWVRYQVKTQQVILEIRDNGKGFERQQDVEALTRNNHFGLAGIIERAEAIGGTVKITTEPGKGTTLLVTAPRPARNNQ